MSSMILGVPPSPLPFLSVFCPILTPTRPSLCDSSYHSSLAHVYFFGQQVVFKHLRCPRPGQLWVNKIGPVSALMGLPDQCRDIDDEQQPEGNGVWGRETTLDGQQGRLLCRGDSKSEGLMPPPPLGPRKPSLTFLTCPFL